MSYVVGRRFEYRVIDKLNKLGIRAIRNRLSRKPDIYSEIGLFEIKKTLKKGKDKCFVMDIEDYINLLEGKDFNYDVKEYNIEEKFYLLTIEKGKLKVIIPFWLDLEYVKKIKQDIRNMVDKLWYYIYWEVSFKK